MKKYAFANVKIPLEVLSNGSFQLLKEYIQVEFTHCNELPSKRELNMDFTSILNDLFKQDKIKMDVTDNDREIKIKDFIQDEEPKFETKKQLFSQNEAENEQQHEKKEKEKEHEQQPHEKEQNQEYKQEPEKIVILATEIKQSKNNKKNTSFKNRKNSHNFTNKKYT
jgi:hypothetical protein